MATEKLINRQNYDEMEEFLAYQRDTKQNDPKTIEHYRNCLTHLLRWAWEKELRTGHTIRPLFVEYLEALRLPNGERISAAYFSKICKVAAQFYLYQREKHRNAYAKISIDWVESIRPPRLRSEQAELKTRELYTLEDTIKLATWPTKILKLRRTQAGAAFLFMTGMRIAAFMSLPISCVDLDGLKVSQFPQLGVKTKNKKAAKTTILPVEELLGVVREWDRLVRGQLGADHLWYPNLSRQDPEVIDAGMPGEDLRGKSFHEDLQELCSLAGVRYLSPHKFRHGHAVFGLKRSRNMQEWKAVSQNLMHANTGITDAIYGTLVQDDQHATMLEIGRKAEGAGRDEGIDLDALAEKIAERMRKGI